MAAHHAGHGDQADILAERGIGQRAEHTRNRRADTVGKGRACHQAHADDDRPVQLEAELERAWQLEPTGIANIAQVHVAHDIGHDIARNQAQQHGSHGEQPACEELQAQRHEDHHARLEPVRHAAPCGLAFVEVASTACRVFNANLHQRQADHQHDQARHQRRQREADFADKQPKEGMEQPADDNTRHQPGKPGRACADHGGDHHGQKRKTGALYDGKFRTNRSYADGLDQRRHPGKEHRHLDQVDQRRNIRVGRAKAETCHACDDDSRRHVRDKHRQNVLYPQRDRLAQSGRVIWVAELLRCPD